MCFENEHILFKMSKRIRVLRKQNDLTYVQCLIEKEIYFYRIEQAKQDISFTTLCKICLYFDVTLEDFFKDFEYQKPQ